MKRFWFKSTLWITIILGVAAFFSGSPFRTVVLAQESTAVAADVFITVTYSEQINIRSGPSTVLYDIIGNMQPGESAPALGVSPGREWIQISFPGVPGGIGWVHNSLVTLSSGNLQIVEPPPTSTPRVTATIDPTLAAAFVVVPTQTRLSTFTPPPPLEVPQFTPAPDTPKRTGLPLGAILLILGIPGVVGMIFSRLRRRW